MTTDKDILLKKTGLEDAITIARKGTHCGMCRIDFLGTGLCPSGKKHGYLAYWPQGRMELVKHLKEGKIKPTEKLIEIVGEQWATNDPNIIVSYTRSIIPPDSELKFYIVMPESTEQVSKIIKFANKHNIPFMARSGGTTCSVTASYVLIKAFSLDHGIVMDLLRLN